MLDGHAQLHVHPYELHIGHPTKADWPALDLDAGAEAWLELLSEPVLSQALRDRLPEEAGHGQIEDYPTLPFTVVPTLIEHLFRLLCADHPPESQREVVDTT